MKMSTPKHERNQKRKRKNAFKVTKTGFFKVMYIQVKKWVVEVVMMV
jgi:hypothetical protein